MGKTRIFAEGFIYKFVQVNGVLVMPETDDADPDVMDFAIRGHATDLIQIYYDGAWRPVPNAGTGAQAIRTITANDFVQLSDDTILIDTTAGDVALTWDPSVDTKVRHIKNIGVNVATVTPLTGTIDGEAMNTIGEQEVRTIQSDLTNLYLLA